MTYLPRKRFAEFQHAWFTQARNYIDGECTEAVPSTSGRVKDHGAESRVAPQDCKASWDSFIKSSTASVAVNDQRVIISSLAYAVYDLMIDNMKDFKADLIDTSLIFSLEPTPEHEEIIHRYLGFAVKSLIDNKHKYLKNNKAHVLDTREELKVLNSLVVRDHLPETVLELSEGGLTMVSSEMVLYGGDVLYEFSKISCKHGNKSSSELVVMGKEIILNDKVKECFERCVANATSDSNISKRILSTLFCELTNKIVNARVNEMVKA